MTARTGTWMLLAIVALGALTAASVARALDANGQQMCIRDSQSFGTRSA